MPKGKAKGKFKVPEYHIKDNEFRAAVAAARTAYMIKNTGEAPSIEEVNAVCEVPMHRLGRILSSEEFIVMMTASGIPWRKVKGLTAKQNYMLLILTNPNERRPFEQCLRDAGVTRVEYNAWMRQPLFSGIIEQLTNQALGDHRTVANNALMKKVESGDVRALQFYYEMTGIYNPNATQERDMQAVVAGIIDIIQRNVHDPEILKSIAGEIKHLMTGGRPSAAQITATPHRSEQDEELVDINFVDVEEPEPIKAEPIIPNKIPPVAAPSRRLIIKE